MKWPRAAGPILAAAKLEVRLLVVLVHHAAKGCVRFCSCGHVVNARALCTCPQAWRAAPSRHTANDHAIRLKSEMMVDHFHEQALALNKIGGQARAMARATRGRTSRRSWTREIGSIRRRAERGRTPRERGRRRGDGRSQRVGAASPNLLGADTGPRFFKARAPFLHAKLFERQSSSPAVDANGDILGMI